MTHGDAPAPEGPNVAPLDELVARIAAQGPRDARYRRIGEIGRGGMGAILHVWDGELHRGLAMKVALKRTAEEESGSGAARFLGRFLEEAQVTGQLEHPGIVPVHEIGLGADGGVYFTMRLVKGRTLLEIQQLAQDPQSAWNQTRVLGVLLKVCEAVAFAHSREVVHRDLKPANVMVGSFGEVYVMDWGLARIAGRGDAHDLRLALDDEDLLRVRSERGVQRAESPDSSLMTLDGEIVGTPAYMPPEQAGLGDGEIGPGSDVYAVGAMLYQLLAGRPPYVPKGQAMTAIDIVRAIRAGPPTPIAKVAPDTPAELAAICEKAMARDLTKRYPSMIELRDDLQSYLENRVVRAYRTGAWQEFKKWVQRNKGMAASLAGLLVVALAGVAVIAWLQHTNKERVLGVSDVGIARELEDRAGKLWPALPEQAPAMQQWIQEAEALHARLPYQRESLAHVDELGTGVSRQKWLRENLESAIGTLEKLPQWIGGMTRRRELALSVAERTVSGPAAKAAWDRAIAAIAVSPRYGGLRITPQIGLMPLEADSASGLWEFWHTLSGDEPPIDGERDRRVLVPESGIVLVLVPGGSFSVGNRSAGDSFVDPYRQSDEQFFEGVEIAPFFISKYETTQAQWRRIMGKNPSQIVKLVGVLAPVHPVETMSWLEAKQAAHRVALELPTEAQWEVACRSGTDTAWSFGPAAGVVMGGRANIADLTLYEAGTSLEISQISMDVRDGFAAHAQVGSLEPNAFGLFDMHGNVWEWCRDEYTSEANPPPRAGDGLRMESEKPSEATMRGGSWYANDAQARCANRLPYEPQSSDQDLGVRFARRVDP